MTLTQDQIDALDHLLDDHYAVWDFGDGLPRFRPNAGSAKIAELIELVQLGLVQVSYGHWHKNDLKPCSAEAAAQALMKASTWRQTDGEPGFVLALSDPGYDLLRSLGFGGPRSP